MKSEKIEELQYRQFFAHMPNHVLLYFRTSFANENAHRDSQLDGLVKKAKKDSKFPLKLFEEIQFLKLKAHVEILKRMVNPPEYEGRIFDLKYTKAGVFIKRFHNSSWEKGKEVARLSSF